MHVKKVFSYMQIKSIIVMAVIAFFMPYFSFPFIYKVLLMASIGFVIGIHDGWYYEDDHE